MDEQMPASDRSDIGREATDERARASAENSRSNGWRLTALIAIALMLAAAVGGLWIQQSRLSSTRDDLASVRTTQDARLTALEKSASSLQLSLESLSAEFATDQKSLKEIQSAVASAQAEFQAAEARLQADEQQLNLTH